MPAIPQNSEEYEQFRELHWSLVKMDVYQSFLGSTAPLLRSNTDNKYPPRAPMGTLSTIHGTHDYLMLLLKRVAIFSESERARKREPASGAEDSSLPGSPQSYAWGEWDRLRRDFETFKDGLGPWFEPLETDSSARIESPFGPALQFRTYSVAGIWMNFYMGLVHLHRHDPTLPRQAVIAAGMVARRTESLVDQIGRIAAGVVDESSQPTGLNPAQGAVMIESCIPLFTVGAQVSSEVRATLSTVQRMLIISHNRSQMWLDETGC